MEVRSLVVHSNFSVFRRTSVFVFRWTHGRRKGRAGGALTPWILKLLAKNVIFSISRGKKQILRLLPAPWKNLWENPQLAPWKKSLRCPWMNLWVVEQQVKMDVSIWDAVHSHSMAVSAEWSRCLGYRHGVLETVLLLCDEAQQVGCLRG